MVRERETDDDTSRSNPTGRKRRKKRRYVLGLFLVFGLVLIAALPTILTSRSVLLPLVDRFAGIQPMKVDFTRVTAGWFQPIRVDGLQLLDGGGKTIAKVGSIETDKGVASWIMSSNNLGSIRISDIDLDVLVDAGSTSIEKAIEPLTQSNVPQEKSTAKPATYAGTIELVNARIALRDTKHPDVWLVTVPTFKTQLPGANQVVGPTQLSASISDATGVANGSIVADVAESMSGNVRSFNVRTAAEHIPLAFWHVLHERLPEIPIQDLAGSVTARIAGALVDGQTWSFNVEQLSGDGLVVSAPELLGAKPARLTSFKMLGKAALGGGSLVLDGAQVATDFGAVTAAGKMPWPIVPPTLTTPWLSGAQIDAQGTIDLARLVQVAETLVPMRADTRLVSGSATFRAAQQLNTRGQPSSVLDLQLGDLVATANGQKLQWDQPLKMTLSAQPQADGQVGFQGKCEAEFCTVSATGSTSSGSFIGEVSLDRLQQRLAQWVELPVSKMSGTANVDMKWSQPQPGLISAQGRLKTTPLTLGIAGGQLIEPAWEGTITGQGQLDGSQLTSVQRGHIELTAQSEKLKIDLLEPLYLTSKSTTGNASSNATSNAPAAFTISSEGALDLWQKRAVMLKLIDPTMTMAGNYSFGASGRIDASHMELLQANWRSQPFEIGSGGSRLVEPEMVGNFQGRIDTNDLTRLAIEKLVVQAHSFSLSAEDAASPSGGGRIGTGAYILDLSQFMRNIHTENVAGANRQLVLPPGVGTPPSAPESQLAFTGQVNGSVHWQVDAKSAKLDLDAKSNQIDVIQQVAGSAPQRLWSEAQVVASLKGAWDAVTGNIDVEAIQLQAPWMHYAGTAKMESSQGRQTIRANGQCLYDAAMVATKLQPYIGNNVQMAGRKTVPVEIVLTMDNASTNVLSGLQATTRIGWEQARVVGIEVGPADVPVNISAGQLATATEIPVSGGKLRWDITSDLSAAQTVIIQKPMTVLENAAITPQMCQSWLKYVTPLLAEATSVDGRLSLTLKEARYNVSNPRDQIIDGQLIIHSAAVGPGPLSNQVISLVQQVNAIRKKELASAVSNQQVWLQMPQQTIAFRMENGRVFHRDLMFHVGDVNLISSGSVDIDGRMDLVSKMPIPDDWIAKSPLLASMRGQTLQFPIRGSLTSPQVDAQFLRDFTRQAVSSAAEGLIQQQLTRGLGKLFGPMPTAPGTAVPPAPTPGTTP